MADIRNEGVQDIEDVDGVRFFAFRLPNGRRMSLPVKLLTDGIEIASGAALATCTWKWNFHPMWPFCFSLMTIEGAVYLCKHLRKLYRKLSYIKKVNVQSFPLLITGTIIYFPNVVAFSESLKQNDKTWIIYFGIATVGYCISTFTNDRLERIYHYEEIFLDINPVYKCFQLLFEPTLIAIAAYYLLGVQNHDEQWLRNLLMILSVISSLNAAFQGFRRMQNIAEERWSLLNGLELLMGGCIVCINIAVIIIYAINNQFNLIIIAGFIFLFCLGIQTIDLSLYCFQNWVEMDVILFFCLCDMIRGPVIFFSSWLCASYITRPIVIPAFIILSGIGLNLLANAIYVLHCSVPAQLFNRYCQRVLGPVATVYSSWVSAITWHRMGWKYSMATMPLIAAGIYFTYRGWK